MLINSTLLETGSRLVFADPRIHFELPNGDMQALDIARRKLPVASLALAGYYRKDGRRGRLSTTCVSYTQDQRARRGTQRRVNCLAGT